MGLHRDKYTSVYLGQKPIRPWIVKSDFIEQIKLNAGFAKSAHENFQQIVKSPVPYALHRLYKQDPQETKDLDEALHYLGIASKGVFPDPFASLTKLQNWKENSKLALLTERFLAPPTFVIGSARHVLLKNSHLKGVGRNSLSINEDYTHSWGGWLIRDVLKGFITGQYVTARTLLPQMENYGVFLYEDKDEDGIQHAITLRDSRTF